jgi:hypothetical protein
VTLRLLVLLALVAAVAYRFRPQSRITWLPAVVLFVTVVVVRGVLALVD